MARTGGDVHGYDQEEEEKALLLDLPLKPDSSIETEDEFDFCSCACLASGLLPQMCAADELFYGGRVLPFRLSVSSENSSSLRDLSRNASTSDSTDDNGGSSLGCCSAALTLKSRSVQNVFHFHPSPKPQIRAATSRRGSFNGRTQKASTWAFFRLGLVRTPELELQHLKNRMSSHNRGSEANNNGRKGNSSSKLKGNKRRDLLGGGNCKFSVETVPPKTPMKNNSSNRRSTDCKSAAHGSTERAILERKKTQKKQPPSHDRAFEWLEELSHASFPDDSYHAKQH